MNRFRKSDDFDKKNPKLWCVWEKPLPMFDIKTVPFPCPTIIDKREAKLWDEIYSKMTKFV